MNDIQSKKVSIPLAIGILFSSIFLIACSDDTSAKKDEKTKEIIVSSEVASSTATSKPNISSDKQQTGLKITAEQFRKNFDTLTVPLGLQKLKKFQYEKDGKSFKVELEPNFYLIGQVDQNKNIQKLAVTLVLSEANKGNLAQQADVLGGIALTAIKALDGNKVDEKRDDTVQNTYESLLNDPVTRQGANQKDGVYKNFTIYSAFVPDLSSIIISFEPNH
ncbi:hypothetical protein ACX1N5_15425 [Acinetobacter sp. ANC 4636]